MQVNDSFTLPPPPRGGFDALEEESIYKSYQKLGHDFLAIQPNH